MEGLCTMKRLVSVLLILLLTMNVFSLQANAKEEQQKLVENVKSAILIEKDSGQILYEENIHERLAPASMVKIMTMLLVMEAIDEGTLTFEEMITTSDHAASMGGSQIFLEPGEQMTVKQMLLGVAIGSGNDAAVALGERLAGSEESFVQMMNEKVSELGLENTLFKTATGLPGHGDYSSAYDMAMMAKELLKYEKITEFTGLYEAYLREGTDEKFWLVNTNKLVRFYNGADGLKTGFTREAGYCLTATAQKDGMRVIAVVFGAPTSKERNAQVSKLMDFAFNQYQTHQVFDKDVSLGKVAVSKGQLKEVDAITDSKVSVLTKKGKEITDIEQKIEFKKDLKAPIKKGDKIGTLQLLQEGNVISNTPLVAKEDVKEASWWTLFKKTMGLFTKSSE